MAAKDTVYIDIDEDITSVINKVENSRDKVVALVLPKRATVFQSTINMKLLKKAASTAKKSLVLITSDTSILPLAGAARLHVAKSLQSKPSIPDAPQSSHESDVMSSDEFTETTTKTSDVSAEGSATAATVTDEVIELDNTDNKIKKSTDKPVESKKNRKLMVPNFNNFRVKMFLAGLALILVIVGWVFGFIIMPKAKILIKTDATASAVTMQFNISEATKELDIEKALIPGKLAESKKTDTEKVPATGKEDQGTKASGNVKFYNCNIDDKLNDTDRVVPAGTTISDASNRIFITQTEAVVSPSSFVAGNCLSNKPSDNVLVVAEKGGGEYNLSARSYSVSGFTTIIAKDGNGMGGGTSKLVTIVSQDDINGAQSKLTGRQKSAAVGDLEARLNVEGGMAVSEALDEGAPAFTQNVAVGKEDSEVTVTAVTTYKMLGIKTDDLKKVVEASINKSITDTRRKILNNGLANKTLLLASKKSSVDQTMSLSTTATVGPDIDVNAIAREVAGKRRGDIIALLGTREDIKEVTVSYSPFWVLQTPKKATKITVVVDQANAK